jgi:hypothetical protein
MAKRKSEASEDDILKEAKEAFAQCEDAEADNRREALDDIRFARLAEQWPADILVQRQREGRPALTINKMPAFIRQVVNDARQNKPSIKVHPADSGADPETAEIYNGLIRNIEYTSNADVAYDTATECGVANGFGYIRVGLDYAFEDTFDLDIRIDRVANPFSVYADPMSTAADSSDWKVAFVVDVMKKSAFEREYPNASKTNWDGADWSELTDPWLQDDAVMVAEYWTREEYDKPVLMLSDGTVIAEDTLEENDELQDLLGVGALKVTMRRTAKCWRVKQRILNGVEVLKERDWPGQYIPIIPVYGDEVNVEGKRYFRSLIRDAKDSQRNFNFWRSTASELMAMSPKTPFIGPKGFANGFEDQWATANTENYGYLEYNGPAPPQRQPYASVPAGVLQEALNSSDDMKAIIGLYDASLGARSNETSGKAIMARQREGDVSTFHFIDNLSRAIRHTGRVIIDLIPRVYTQKRIIRTIGEDGTPKQTPLGVPVPVTDKSGQPVMQPPGMQPQGMQGPGMQPPPPATVPKTKVYDLSAGKYDLVVKSGPSFSTRREEAATQMTEFIRAVPAAAVVAGDLLVKNFDWPGADELAERLKGMVPPQAAGGLPPEVQKMIEEGKGEIQRLTQENEAMKADVQGKQMQMQQDAQKHAAEMEIKRLELQIEMRRLTIDEFGAQTDRMQAMKPEPPSPPPGQPRKAA